MNPLLLAVAIAFQGTPQAPAAAASCDSTKTTAEIRRCADREFDDAKHELKRYAAEARRFARKPALLDSAQREWEHFRDLACRAAGSEYDGSDRPVAVVRCLAAATHKRAHELYNDFLRKARSALPEPK